MSTASTPFPPSSPDPAILDDEGSDLATNAARPVLANTGTHQTPEKLSPQSNTTGPHQAE